MENIPCTKHEAFPGMIMRISTCNKALDSHETKEVDSETGVVTVESMRVILLLVFFILIVGHNSMTSGNLLVLTNAKFLETGGLYACGVNVHEQH